MAKLLESRLGKIHKFKNNPRKMDDGSFTRLTESLDRRKKFLEVRNIVVWEVPKDLKEIKPDSPFVGQEGQIVILGGNQRYDALINLGYDRIPDDCIIEARDKFNGERCGAWWTPEEAEAFVLMDNNQEGMAGENDYEMLMELFDKQRLKEAGINFAEMPMEFQKEDAPSVEEEVETGEHGERDEELEGFIQRRESSRGRVDEMHEAGFYIVPYWETYDQKIQFLDFIREKFGIENDREIFIDGFKLAEALGLDIEHSGLMFPTPKPVKSLVNLALDGEKEGYEVKGEMPEADELTDEPEEELDSDDGLTELPEESSPDREN